MAATDEERVRRLRDVVAADPTEAGHLEFLANALTRIDGSALEAAALLERAYEVQLGHSAGDYTWRFARNAMWTYERAGSPERAQPATRTGRSTTCVDAMMRTAAHAATANIVEVNRVLQELCREMTLTLFGGQPCLTSIEHAVEAIDSLSAGQAAPLVEPITTAMFTAARTGHLLDAADPGWRSKFEATLTRHVGAEAAARMRHAQSFITLE